MDIFSVISMFGGIALFLYGMSVMSKGLEKAAGGKLDVLIEKMTSNTGKSFLLGTAVTALVQSSSAITVMLMGLVNSGIMRLPQTVAIIMGSNVGTTSTAWIMSIMGVESENFFIRMLKPESFSPILAFIGVVMIMVSKREKKQNIGEIMVGFAILMYGMKFMSSAVSPLADSPSFTSIITAFTNPFLGVLTGMLLTAVIQSSAASVCILQTLSLTGEITIGMAFPIVMGQNIGTCITAILSSVGVNKNARRVAVIHLAFNVIGTLLFLGLYCGATYGLDMHFAERSTSPVGIAIMHTIFNVVTSLVLMPFQNFLVKLSKKVIKVKGGKKEVFLDERLLVTPTIALQECRNLSVDMAEMTKNSMYVAMDLIGRYNDEDMARVREMENEVDKYEDRLGSYLIKLSSCDISDRDRAQVSKLLHTIGDLERISDHAVNIAQVAQEIYEKDVNFSDLGIKELGNITGALKEILNLSVESFDNDNVDMAYRVEPLEEVVDEIIENTKMNHINRLQNGKCTIQHGFIISDLLNDYERVSDHCSNIALGIIELSKTSFEAHDYVNKLIKTDDPVFRKYFREYREKYNITQ